MIIRLPVFVKKVLARKPHEEMLLYFQSMNVFYKLTMSHIIRVEGQSSIASLALLDAIVMQRRMVILSVNY